MPRLLLLLLLLAGCSATTIRGEVVDRFGNPVPHTTLRLRTPKGTLEPRPLAHADSQGHFETELPPTATSELGWALHFEADRYLDFEVLVSRVLDALDDSDRIVVLLEPQ